MKHPFPYLALGAALVLAPGCGRQHEHPTSAASHAAGEAAHHHHVAPHGGTLVEVGEHQFNLEFLFDAERGVLQAWLLDAHAENFVRAAMPGFVVVAQAAGREHTLNFAPVANAVTGETVGDTAQFEAPALWLRDAKAFDGEIKAVTVRGVTFPNLRFSFPINADHDDDEKAH